MGLGTAWARIQGLRPDRVPARRNPHVADEALVFAERWSDGLPYPCVFVRGAVRHEEHRTLRFPHWMRVVPNAEPGTKRGVKWVD